MGKVIELEKAVRTILTTCDKQAGKPAKMPPFFFIVGSGLSSPQVPTALQMVEEFRQVAEEDSPDHTKRPESDHLIDEYSFWFEEAFPNPVHRQEYLREKCEGKQISHANLRLAHLLLTARPKIANIVVTTNFDDFISRALALFGKQHIICDHPRTHRRIDPTNPRDIQIVNVHGSYWFYDCCNLRFEIEDRSLYGHETHTAMSGLLSSILEGHSPIVLGYAGWEQDVIMNSLRIRLLDPPPFNFYWFCYTRADYENLPEWLRKNRNVLFILPEEGGTERSSLKSYSEGGNALPDYGEYGTPTFDELRDLIPKLSAKEVLEKFITMRHCPTPKLIQNPLEFYATQLEESLILEEDKSDIYSIKLVIEVVRAGAKQAKKLPVNQVINAVRNARYGEAINAAEVLNLDALDLDHLYDLKRNVDNAIRDLPAQEQIRGSDILVKVTDRIIAKEDKQGALDSTAMTELSRDVAHALINKGNALGQLERREEAIKVYDQVVERFCESDEPSLQKQWARALVRKGVALGQLERGDEAIKVYDQVVKRLGKSDELSHKEQVAKALVNKAYALGQPEPTDEAIEVYDQVVKLFRDSPEIELQEQVAIALVNKASALGELKGSDEAIKVYDQVVERFGESEEPPLREAVAKALFNKADALDQSGRNEEAIEVYDQMLERFGDSPDPSLREAVASALVSKGYTLSQLQRNREAIEACDQIVERFGDSPEPSLAWIVEGAKSLAESIRSSKKDQTVGRPR